MATERFPVEAGHIMLFARAIADPNPVYRDAVHAAAGETGGVIAPPTFASAASQFREEHPLRPGFGTPWFGSGRDATGVPPEPGSGGGGGLHAEQHFTYHRPLRAGDVLVAETVPGRTWTKQGRKGGELVFTENVIEYRNSNGELVVTAVSVGVRTSKTVQQEA